MRLLSAALVGVLTSLFVVAAPTVTITMESQQPDQGAIRPTVTLSTATNGTLDFRRYTGTSCFGGFINLPSVTVTTSATTYVGPDLQTGTLGQFSAWVRLRSGSTTLDTKCFPYLVQRRVTAVASLPKPVYDNNDRLEPTIELTNPTPDAGGQVEVARWSTPGCGPANAVSAGILSVVGGVPQGTVNMQTGVMGTYSFRVTYSGDSKNTSAASLCKGYSVGVYIRGKVFQDNDGSGTIDPGEEGLAGATVTVRKGQTSIGSATTSSSGLYEILVTSPGTYTVSETPPKGYEGTGPAELTVQVTSSTVDDRNFGVAQVPSTLLPSPTAAPSGDVATNPPRTASNQSSFTFISFLALGLVVVATLVLSALLFLSRNRNEGL